MLVYLIRHGEFSSDIEDRYGGRYDDQLTERGREQAKELGKRLSGEELDLLIYSPYHRAGETAQILRGALACPQEKNDAWRERDHYGVMSGMTKKEARVLFPDEAAKLSNHLETVNGGEPYDNFRRRIMAAFASLIVRPFNRVGILTHGGPIRCVLRELVEKEVERPLRDCEVIVLEVNGEKVKLFDEV